MAFSFASMFSGGGGWDLGAHALGGRGLWSIEYNAAAAGVFAQNLDPLWPGHRTLVASVTDVDPDDLARPDVLLCSPPCQAYSKVRYGTKTLAPRCDAHLGLEVVRYASALRPRVVLVENVPTYRTSATYAAMVAGLEGLGYVGATPLLDGMYYGMPARRHRMLGRFVLGAAPPPMPPRGPTRGWYEAVRDLAPGLRKTTIAPWQAKRLARQLERTTLRWPLLISGYNYNSKIWDRGDTVHIGTSANEPSPAIMASWKSMSGTRLLDSDGDTRSISTRVLARLQTFPDGYALPADNELACRIVGNAVPPLLARAMIAPFVR